MRSATFAHLGKEVSFVVHDRDYISNVLVHGKMFFESEILEYIRTTFPAQKTVVDVGANIGNHSRYFLEFLSPTRLVAFEPFPPNLELLKQNIASDRTEIFPYGLGAHARVTGIRFNPENLGICVLDDNLPAVIEIKTLDSFQLNDVTLLKVDVEGDDLAVIEGASETIRRCRPTIVVEGNFDALFPRLAPLGYVCIAYWKQYQTYCFVPAALLSGK